MLSTLALALVLSAAPPPRKSLPASDPLASLVAGPGMEFYRHILVDEEPKQLWKQIHWLQLDEVQAKAHENRKPILFVTETGSDGKANAPFT
jgi:hypothetical protein